MRTKSAKNGQRSPAKPCTGPVRFLVLRRDGRLLWPRRPRIGRSAKRKGIDVKLIIAAIKPFKLEEVREALTAIGVRGMMVTEIKGFGIAVRPYRNLSRRRIRRELRAEGPARDRRVSDSLAEQVVETIRSTAKTDKIGDGKIFVLDVEHAVRVRTGETDDDAL